MKTKIKDKRIVLVVDVDEELLLLRASAYMNLRLSTWVRSQALIAAKKLLQQDNNRQTERVS